MGDFSLKGFFVIDNGILVQFLLWTPKKLCGCWGFSLAER